MKTKITHYGFRLIVILLLSGSQSLFAQLVTRASDNATFTTIQTAIDDAGTINGDVLNVAAGAYYENVLVNKEVSIIGPKAGVDGTDPSRGTDEAVLYPQNIWYGDGTYNGGYLFRVTADNVTIEGFTLNGDNPALTGAYSTNHGAFDIDFGILSYWSPWYEDLGDHDPINDMAGDNLKIKNNVLKNFKIHAIYMQSDYNNPVPKAGEILNNKIQNVAGHAIFLLQNYYANIEYNTLEAAFWGITTYFTWLNKPNSNTGTINNNSINLSEIVTNYDYAYTERVGIQMIFLYNGIIDAWEISGNNVNNLNTRSSGSNGIAISHCEGQALSIHDNTISNFENGYMLNSSVNFWTPGALPATVSGGTVSNCTYGVTAINLEEWLGNNPTDHYQLNGLTIQNSTVAGVFATSTNVNYDAGFGFNTPTYVFVDVNNCIINNNLIGIFNSGNLASTTAHNNNLSVNSSFAINNTSVNSVDATCNWYGQWTGPTNAFNKGGTGGIVEGNVTFEPWLVNGTDDDNSISGFQPVPGSCIDIKCGNKNDKYLICHNGTIKCVDYIGALDHLTHSDTLGECTSIGNDFFKVTVYSNPSLHNFELFVESELENKIEVNVFDLSGTMLVKTVTDNNKPIQFGENLNKGIYIIHVIQGENLKIIKIVKF